MIDASVHPSFPRPEDLTAYLPREYRKQRLPLPLEGLYPLPIDTYVEGSTPNVPHRPPRADVATDVYHPHVGTTGALATTLPGSDPKLMDTQVLDGPGADYAILLPLTRGVVGDPRLEVAIDAATNEWLAETWLGDFNEHGRYRGSIRVCTRSPADAVKEIERWAGHPHFVQVAVPIEASRLFGEQFYFPIWKAAAEHGLPVAVHSDHSAAALPPPTPLGYPMSGLEAYAQHSLQTLTHLTSLIGHGVFDRLESLVFVFADGGFDYMTTVMWRVDNDWRQSRAEVPWVSRAPSEYVRKHVRYVVHDTDAMADPEERARFIELNDLGGVLLYGSNYPHWDHLPHEPFSSPLPEASREAIVDGNARNLYGLGVAPAAGALA
jgi:predicted TIM-barrel fold metal-dependent hydrolase